VSIETVSASLVERSYVFLRSLIVIVRIALVLCVTSLLCLSPVARSGDDDKDAKTMEGTWLPTEAELAGEKFPDKILKSIKLVVKDEKYTVTIGEATDEGTCKVDATKEPKSMDIKGTEGPNKGKTFLCIYELKDDTLKVCYDLSGKERPTEFKTKADTQLYLVTYKREKP
jgi:uncharacterized protein (TIGR03067 family)